MSSPVVNLSLSLREARMVVRAISECNVACHANDVPWREQCDQWQVITDAEIKLQRAIVDAVESKGISRGVAHKAAFNWAFEKPLDPLAKGVA